MMYLNGAVPVLSMKCACFCPAGMPSAYRAITDVC